MTWWSGCRAAKTTVVTPPFPDWPPPDPAVRDALIAAFADGSWGRYHGGHVEALERRLADLHRVAHAVTCASGTLAIEVALKALGVGPGDEVILGAYDYEPSFLTVHALGATPVLVDVSATDAGIDPIAIEAAVTPRTRAVLATHLHGGLVPMSAVRAVADKHGFGVVEDAAQVSGATVEGRPAGAWGDVGVLSFGGSKLLSAGRGGAVLTSRADLLQRLRLALSRGVQHWAALSELQAIVLGPQLDRLAERTVDRHRGVERLTANLADIPGLRPFRPAADGLPGYYKLGFYQDESAFGLSRGSFVKTLRAEGVAFDPGFRALHVGRAASRYRAGGPVPNATAAGEAVVILHHPVLALGNAAVDSVADAVRKTYRNAARLR